MLNPKHILILEKDQKIARLYERVLEHHGYRTLRPHRVEDALHQFAAFDPDLICLDYEIGKHNCVLLLEHLQQLEPHSRPQVILSASAGLDKALLPYQQLIAQVFYKPVSVYQLVTTVEELGLHTNRRVFQGYIHYELLRSQRIMISWSGYISDQLIQNSDNTILQNCREAIFDIRALNLLRFNFNALRQAQGHYLARFQRVMVLHRSEDREYAEMIQHYLGAGSSTHYFTSLDAALNAMHNGNYAAKA